MLAQKRALLAQAAANQSAVEADAGCGYAVVPLCVASLILTLIDMEMEGECKEIAFAATKWYIRINIEKCIISHCPLRSICNVRFLCENLWEIN